MQARGHFEISLNSERFFHKPEANLFGAATAEVPISVQLCFA